MLSKRFFLINPDRLRSPSGIKRCSVDVMHNAASNARLLADVGFAGSLSLMQRKGAPALLCFSALWMLLIVSTPVNAGYHRDDSLSPYVLYEDGIQPRIDLGDDLIIDTLFVCEGSATHCYPTRTIDDPELYLSFYAPTQGFYYVTWILFDPFSGIVDYMHRQRYSVNCDKCLRVFTLANEDLNGLDAGNRSFSVYIQKVGTGMQAIASPFYFSKQ
jgi:hypothetical protein